MKYINEAIARGAVAVVAPERTDAKAECFVQVTDIRSAAAKIAARYFGYPSRQLDLIGVTGTNGKTTVTYEVKSILDVTGEPVGLIGTTGYDTGRCFIEAINTTPGPLELESLFSEMLSVGVRAAVMEVSSHALAMKRVDELCFRVVAITNITQDHFDFHGDFEHYRQAKSRLLELVEGNDRWTVLNADDPSYDYLRSRVRSSCLTFSLESSKADVRLKAPELSIEGSSFILESPIGEEKIHTHLLGKFNLENSLCAAACAIALGVRLPQIAEGLSRLQAVPGRAHKVDIGQPFTVLIDYAHTPDALAKVLAAARPLTRGRLLALFGCGGDRDRTKRAPMGRAASAAADIIVVTSDNPRTEDALAIIEEIKPGLDRSKPCIIEPDRRAAIRLALDECREGDLLVIAGKGHENYQIIGTTKQHFDDREEVESYLKEKRL